MEITVAEVTPSKAVTETHESYLEELYGNTFDDIRAGRLSREKFIAQQKTERLRLEDQADHDPLTGALNLNGFQKALTTELQTIAHLPGDHTGVLAFIDVDQLKPVNDTHGHQAGDQLLITFVSTIHEVIDESLEAIYLKNPRVVTIFGRIGGDEFGLYLGGCDRKLAETIIHTARDRIKQNVSTTMPFIPEQTVSTGLTYVQAGDNVDSCLKRADTAMYAAKDRRDDVYFVY